MHNLIINHQTEIKNNKFIYASGICLIMVWVVFGDIQGNYNALERFFELTREITDKFYCLGDIVDKGSRYEEERCIEALINRGVVCVRGNHDTQLIELHKKEPENVLKTITQQSIDYLIELPNELVVDNVHFSHEGPTRSKRIFTTEDVVDKFATLKRKQFKIGFYGHSHKLAVFLSNVRIIQHPTDRPVILQEDHSYLINPGGVGLRFGMIQSYAVFNPENETIEFRYLF